jgi:hypothetical protein
MILAFGQADRVRSGKKDFPFFSRKGLLLAAGASTIVN